MNQDDIIRMAREAGAMFDHMTWVERDLAPVFERFAKLVAEHERKACAAVCYRHAAFVVDPIDKERIHQCAAAIRSRGQA